MTRPLLAFDHVCRTFWRGAHEIVVLDDVSFELEARELAAVFGRQASGKTTLLRIAAGLDLPDSGTVRLAGAELHAGGRRPRLGGLPDGVGWMQRSGPQISSMTMRDYVAMPLLESTRHRAALQRASRALDRMNAGHLGDAVWSGMSDAERTLAMLARALVREPALLLADDPTAGLDTRDREVLLGLLRRAAESSEMAVLITVPEVPDMLRSHAVMTLSDGELMRASAPVTDNVIDFRPGQHGSA